MQEYIGEQQFIATDDRRHGQNCEMALAMSVPDLLKIIKEKNPDIAVLSLF